jgi:hypothetical protein
MRRRNDSGPTAREIKLRTELARLRTEMNRVKRDGTAPDPAPMAESGAGAERAGVAAHRSKSPS